MNRRGTITLLEESNNVLAKRVAFERYQFLKRLQSRCQLPFYHSMESASDWLFPAGRSDRVYIILWKIYWSPEAPDFLVLCYQHTHGKDKLVYKVHHDPDRFRNRKPLRDAELEAPIKSLHDYLLRIGTDLTGRISQYAKSDLAQERDYIIYKHDVFNGHLTVSSLADGEVPRRLDKEEEYLVDMDLLTGERNFYGKYGLPVAKRELESIFNAQPLAPAPVPR